MRFSCTALGTHMGPHGRWGSVSCGLPILESSLPSGLMVSPASCRRGQATWLVSEHASNVCPMCLPQQPSPWLAAPCAVLWWSVPSLAVKPCAPHVGQLWRPRLPSVLELLDHRALCTFLLFWPFIAGGVFNSSCQVRKCFTFLEAIPPWNSLLSQGLA